jgi:hypothetical protein
MARPRVFLCSTFFDLRQIREDLERFIRELGYEPVRHEAGQIPYGKKESLEASAYREVELCDVLVAVVGGRFGTESVDTPGVSISQAEIKRALEKGVQVFIFVEKSTLAEYSTYLLNKETVGIKYQFADDKRVFEFIEELHGLPRNNAIFSFETAVDITTCLREQFAGLFQRFLEDEQRRIEFAVLSEMRDVAKTLREVVQFFVDEKQGRGAEVREILLLNHPLFRHIQQLLKVDYRVFFTTKDEMNRWLKARGWLPIDPGALDADSVMEWHKGDEYMKLTHQIFDSDGKLIPFSPAEWSDGWLSQAKIPAPAPDDEEMPF